MSYYTSSNQSSAASSVTSFPRSISSSSTSSASSTSSSASRSSSAHSVNSACAYPSWPSGSELLTPLSRVSSYVSDDDLQGLDDAPYLSEPPSPPRPAQQWGNAPVARPLLPPVVKSRRQGSSTIKKKGRTSALSSK